MNIEKTAIVTGAGRGIGRSIAIGFAKSGIRVCCVARTKSEVQETASLIENVGGHAIAVSANVTDYDSVKDFFATANKRFKGIDIVVIAAGISIDQRSVETSKPEEWRQVIETNLIGAYHTAKASIPYFRQRGAGKIIILGSGLGHRGIPERSAYSASKSALWMFTRVLAQELHTYNISVNELIPGPVLTKMAPQREDEIRIKLGQSEWLKKPEDVVPMALFLAKQPDHGPTAQSYSLMRRDC